MGGWLTGVLRWFLGRLGNRAGQPTITNLEWNYEPVVNLAWSPTDLITEMEWSYEPTTALEWNYDPFEN